MTEDETEQRMVRDAETARARVAADVKQLAQQLEPEHLKDRAVGIAEQSLANVAGRVLKHVARSPGVALEYFRKRPLALGPVVLLAVAVAWKFSRRRG